MAGCRPRVGPQVRFVYGKLQLLQQTETGTCTALEWGVYGDSLCAARGVGVRMLLLQWTEWLVVSVTNDAQQQLLVVSSRYLLIFVSFE